MPGTVWIAASSKLGGDRHVGPEMVVERDAGVAVETAAQHDVRAVVVPR